MRRLNASKSEADQPEKAVKPLRAGRIALIVAGVLLVLLAGLYFNRRAAAQQILTSWLAQQGVHARVDVERIELNGFTGRIEIGDPAHPDFVVERAEVDYAIGAPWSQAGLSLTPGRIRLVQPVLAAQWKYGRFSLGSLDPLIKKFTGKPPKPDSRSPLIIVEGGRLRLDSEYGPVEVLADATVNDGKLMRLVARMPAASLKSGATTIVGLQGDVDLTTTGDRVAVAMHAASNAIEGPTSGARDLDLALTGDLPYPDLKTRRGDGKARLQATLNAVSGNAGDANLANASLTLGFNGQTTGWIEAFRLSGATDLALTAGEAAASTVKATRANVTASNARLEVSRSASGFGWNVTGPLSATMARLQANGLDLTGVQGRSSSLKAGGLNGRTEISTPLSLTSERLQFGELDLKTVRSTGDLHIVNDAALQVTATAAVTSSHGAWPLFGPITSEDIPELAEMKRALSDFALSAPALRLNVGPSGTEVRLTAPARLTPANGGVMTLTAASTPIFASSPGLLGGGSLSISATRGKGLPETTFAIPRWSLTPTGFTADLDGNAALDFGLARTLTVATKGRLTSAAGRLTYVPTGCSAFTAGLLELGENDVSDVAGQICPVNVPLVTVADDGWHVRGRFASVSAAAPFLEAKVADAGGTVSVDGAKGGDLSLSAKVEQASVRDAAATRRFNPLRLTGSASMAREQWLGTFDLASGNHPLGQIVLRNDGISESGGLTIDTGMLTFAQGGLQPLDLSPLVAGFISPPVTGQARFTGKFDWAPDTESSSGLITIPGLDFVSPIGDAKGLKGEIVLTSLVPPTTAPNQVVTLDSLAAITPLTDLKLDFGLDASAVTIAGANLRIGGGVVRIEPLAIPFDRSQTLTGALVLESVQIGNIFSGAGLDDKVKLDAVVSGRIPFTSGPDGVRVTGGVLNAIQPGRLSLQREALTGLEASNGDAEASPNLLSNMAYQALENLAFDDMTVIVNSLDAGRLNLRFAVHGRHDPPDKQEIRLTWLQVLRRQFYDDDIPLPSGTGVNLNLDTTLNANQLIGDLLELNRIRQGKDLAESVPAPGPE